MTPTDPTTAPRTALATTRASSPGAPPRPPRRQQRRRALALALLAALLWTACSGDDDGTAAETTTGPTTTEATTAPDTADSAASATVDTRITPVDPGRGFDRLVAYVEAHGFRPAGTEAERAAARWIAEQFEAAGYETHLVPFDYRIERDRSRVTIPGEGAIEARSLIGGAQTEARGPIVYAGLGDTADFATIDASGAVVLVDRGTLTFGAKVANARRAGAVAVVVRNDGPGSFNGTLGRDADIPALAVTGPEGDALLALAGSGAALTVRAERGTVTERSQNVIATPPGTAPADCRGFVGAHYDSVPEGPGANDNASGVAVVLELADTHLAPGLCMVVFGAEELGLFGSVALVEAQTTPALEFVLNIDMAAKNGDLQAIAGGPSGDLPASNGIVERAVAAATDAGLALRPSAFPPNASSDHVPFAEAGIAAFTLHAGDDPAIHTAGDDLATLDAEVFEHTLNVAAVVLAALLPPSDAAEE